MSISDYYVIGDLHTAALLRDGDIEWLCLPAFDSPSVFASMLDDNAGSFTVNDTPHTTTYIPDTAIVESHFDGYTIRDYMPPKPTADCQSHTLYRKIIGTGTVEFTVTPRPDYGDTPELNHNNSTIHITNSIQLQLPHNADVNLNDGTVHITVPLHDDTAILCLEHYNDTPCTPTDEEEHVREYWHDWVKQGEYVSFCRDNLVRSAITLKLMQYYPTGAIVAAPTTSLPEHLGGVRNWDYRYVWIRDATFTLYSLYVLGYTDEARRFFDFIESILIDCNDCHDLQLMYTIDGETVPEEETLDWTGYADSRPVRIGNAAREQFQLDVYGATIDAYYFMHKRGVDITDYGKELVTDMADAITDHWREPDSGIWEVRSGDVHFTYSKVMAWVGLDRAAQLCTVLDIDRREEWRREAETIEDWVWKHCYDGERLTQHPDTTSQDATTFLFVLLHFLDKHDDKTRDVFEAAREELVRDDVFVYRYLTDDGLEGDEGSFVLCTYWLISALAILEDVDEAKRLFTTFSDYIADHGLLAEEIDTDGTYLGNYPQAFSHMGYIMAAHYINKYEQRT